MTSTPHQTRDPVCSAQALACLRPTVRALSTPQPEYVRDELTEQNRGCRQVHLILFCKVTTGTSVRKETYVINLTVK